MKKSTEEGGAIEIHNDRSWLCVLLLAAEKRG